MPRTGGARATSNGCSRSGTGCWRRTPASAWLDAVEAELAGHAVAVALARAETMALLSAAMLRRCRRLRLPFRAGRIALVGRLRPEIAGRSAAEAELWYRRALAESRAADRAAGRTLNGPHRSDLDVIFAEKDMPAALSSTGEQKALLIGLILAHAELVAGMSGMTPILLLDEVAAHLDASRRAALFERLAALGCQTFVTGTDAALFKAALERATRSSASLPAGSNRRASEDRPDRQGFIRGAARLAACGRPAAQSASPSRSPRRSRSCRRRSRSSSSSG